MSSQHNDQAQAVYAAEDLWSRRSPGRLHKFGNWNEVWPFYFKLAEACRKAGIDVSAPAVKARKGALKAHYDPTQKAVFLPPYESGGVWALNTYVAIHEFAHHVTPGQGHGPAYRKAMLDCLNALGWDECASDLEECYHEVGLSLTDKADSITDKVGKLLSHADGASTEEERNTFVSKAESLAAEHSLNLALIRKRQADADKTDRDRPTTSEMFPLTALPNATYQKLAVELGNEIANAHGARCTIWGKSKYMIFYGFPEDIQLTELMFARLTPVMFEEADAYLKTPEHKESGVAGVSARITFCQSFALKVGSRLREAVEEVNQQASRSYDSGPGQLTDHESTPSVEMVLAEKAVEVANYVDYEFKRQGVKGSWKGSRTSNWSYTASHAGRTAGARANLYGRRELAG